ncbi:MAG: NADH dehydrogenase [Dethiobacter sp.]|nr:NADH dehydrogenase [Dethiobacter sp.]
MFFSAPAVEKPLETIQSILPLLIVLLPMAGAVVAGLIGRLREDLRDFAATGTALTAFALTLALYPHVSRGTVVYSLPRFIGLGLNFRVDFLGFVFTALASFIWFLATFYSSEYMRHEQAPTRYYVFLLFSLGGCLGVFLTADFFSLFLFFEAMTLFSYALVVHNQSPEAMAAGRNYLYMGIFGGLCLLSAMIILFTRVGTLDIVPSLEAAGALGELRYLLAILFFIGFGIKAGAAPLHIWLPQAHPVAPTPASALLSGIMIKTGAYGIIRVFNLFLTPPDGHSPLWAITGELGYWIIWIGIVTMSVAAVLALSQTHAKRVLAYSSVSQMGYILMGIGAAAYLGYEGAMGFAGLSYHILNHAFFKAGMFLMVGAVYLRTHDLNYDKLGGLWRSFPVTAAAFLVAGAAISGVPGFNGYASKTLLHHAIVEAFEHHHASSLWVAEKIFTVTGGLTFCYILRLFTSIFTGPARAHGHGHKLMPETPLERVIFGSFAAIILAGGLLPGRVIEKIIIPMSRGFSYDSYAVAHLTDINVWNSHDLSGIAVSLAMGIVVFAILQPRNFAFPLPLWLSIETRLYKPVLGRLLLILTYVGWLIETIVEGSLVGSIGPLSHLTRSTRTFERKALPWAGESALQAGRVIRDRSYDFVVSRVRMAQVYIRHLQLSAFSTMIKLDYNPRGEQLYRKLTLMNLDVCIFIVVIMLVVVFSLRLLNTMGL